MKNEKINIFIVLGPTACGKTTNAKSIADFLGCTTIIDEPTEFDLSALNLKYSNQKILILTSRNIADLPDVPINVKVMGFFYVCSVAGIEARKPFQKLRDGKVGEIEILQTYTIHGESETYLPVGNKYSCFINEHGLVYFTEEDEPGEPATHFLSDLNEDGINYKFHRL